MTCGIVYEIHSNESWVESSKDHVDAKGDSPYIYYVNLLHKGVMKRCQLIYDELLLPIVQYVLLSGFTDHYDKLQQIFIKKFIAIIQNLHSLDWLLTALF